MIMVSFGQVNVNLGKPNLGVASSIKLLQVIFCRWKITYGFWSANLWEWQIRMLVFEKKVIKT
jgi:hypothetical protein